LKSKPKIKGKEHDSWSEVALASRQDWKHDTVDNAKKRAIQISRDYNEFKALVSGCTLKPIHKDEFNTPPTFKYNYAAPTSHDKSQDEQLGREIVPDSTVKMKIPKNSGEFERDLRRAKDKEGWLKSIPLESLKDIFKKNIDQNS